MCGRFAQIFKYDQLKKLLDEYDIQNRDEQIPIHFNIAPTNVIPSFISTTKGNVLTYFQWGLIPSWSKTAETQYKMINVRAESVLEKPTFKSAITRRRCIIPASGFYEWQKPSKQPYFIHPTERGHFAFAGIWDRWLGADGSEIQTLAIITCAANETMKPIHERMPVILTPDTEKAWLSYWNQDPVLLSKLLLPLANREMEAYPVSTFVSNVRNEGEECVARIS